MICEPRNLTSLHPKSSETISKTCGGTADNLEPKQGKQESKNQKMFGPHFVTFLLCSLISKRSVSKWGAISSIQCDPIRPPRACLLTLLVAHITGTFYQTKLSVHSLWLLFQVDVYILLYVNDIYRCSEQLSFILFADDTNIFYQHKDINVLIETLNNEL